MPSKQPLKPAPMRLQHDLPCVDCAYNLRGLQSDGRCPECGSDIQNSLYPRRLRYADPKWLRTLRSGIALVLCGFLAYAPLLLMPLFAGRKRGEAFLVLLMVWFLGAALEALGIVRLTAPNPDFGPPSSRRALMIIASLLYLGLPLGMGVCCLGPAGVVGRLVSCAGICITLMEIARKIPDHNLVWQTKVCLWTCSIGAALCFFTMFLLMVNGIFSFGGRWPGGEAFLTVVGLLLTIFTVWFVIVLLQFLRALGTVLDAAPRR